MLHGNELESSAGKLTFKSADVEIWASLGDKDVTIDVVKSGARVHRVTVSGAVGRMEHSWLAELFSREDKVDLRAISHDAEDYVSNLDIRQG
ncbi:MAG: hypothetical protein JSS20_04225 [Proteobacteria bacterium]|nr:hypothetical protein [Pseudomonadota bacterium]